MSWKPQRPNWNTLAGRMLDTFFSAVHEALPDYALPLTVFGSAPIQLCLDEEFTSADVDIMILEDSKRLREIAKLTGFGRSGMNPTFGVQICPPALFRPTPHYLQRAHSETRHGLKIIVPHLRDILIGKLHRTRIEGQQGLVPKDRRAFQRIRELCDGHPTKTELLDDLITCEPFFRPIYDDSINAFRHNVEDMLREVYDHTFDMQRDILNDQGTAAEPANNRVANMIHDLLPDRE